MNKIIKCDRLNIHSPGRRIVYTCIHASLQYLALGTNVGTIYVYNLATLSLVKTLDNLMNNKLPIVYIRFSPIDTNIIAVTYQNGVVIIIDGRVENINDKYRHICKIEYHLNNMVTCFSWNSSGDLLVIGDNTGNVSIAYKSSLSSSSSSLSSSSLSSSSLLTSSVSGLLQSNSSRMLTKQMPTMDSSIVQIELDHDLIAISTLTRCLIGSIKQFQTNEAPLKQVGKNLRRGFYGACFDPNSNGRLLAGRPGKRLWLVDSHHASVLSTLKLKLPNHLWRFEPYSTAQSSSSELTDTIKQACNFTTLIPFKDMVVSYTGALMLKTTQERHDGCLVFIDAKNCCIQSYYTEFGNITNIALGTDGNLYILHHLNKKIIISKIQVCNINEYVTYLLESKKYVECATLIIKRSKELSNETLERILLKYNTIDIDREIYEELCKIVEKSRLKPKKLIQTHETPQTFRAIDTTIPFPTSESETKNMIIESDKTTKVVADILSPHGTSSSLSVENGKKVRTKKPKRIKKQRSKKRVVAASIVMNENHHKQKKKNDDDDVSIDMKSIVHHIIKISIENVRENMDKTPPIEEEKIEEENTMTLNIHSNSHVNDNHQTMYEKLYDTHTRLCAYKRESTANDNLYQIHHILYAWFIDLMLYLAHGYIDKRQCNILQWRMSSSEFQLFSTSEPYSKQLDAPNENETHTHTMLQQCLLWFFECMLNHYEFDNLVVWNRERIVSYLNAYIHIMDATNVYMISNINENNQWIMEHIPTVIDKSIETAFNRDDMKDAFVLIRKSSNPLILYQYVQRLLDNNRVDKNELNSLFVDTYPFLLPWYIRTLVKTDDNDNYMLYLYDLIQKNNDCAHNQQLLHEWIELALSHKPNVPVFRQRKTNDLQTDIACKWSLQQHKDDVPVENAHEIQWPYGSQLQDILKSRVNTLDHEYMCILFARNGYFSGLQCLYYHHEDALYSAIELGIQTNDLYSIERIMKRYCGDHRSNGWAYLIKCIMIMYNEVLLPYIQLMIRVLGIQTCMNTLETILEQSNYNDKNIINLKLIKEIISHANGDAERARLRHDMLEVIDAHLWTHTSTSSAMTEPFRTLLACEEELLSNRKTLEETKELRTLLQRLQDAFSNNIDRIDRSYEDLAMSTHWGHSIYDDECVCANCNMKIRSLDDMKECIVYQCGHIYHNVCAFREYCTVCFQLDSLLLE